MNAPPPFPSSLPEEAARLRALDAYHILDTPEEDAFDRIAALTARVLRAPIAAVSFVDDHRQWFKAAHGVSKREDSREVSFCAHALASDALLVVPNATLDPRFAANPLVTGPSHIRFYAGAPLLAPRFPRLDAPAPLPRERARLGTLCVIDPAPRPGGLLSHEGATLRDLAGLVVEAMLHRLASEDRREEAAGRRRAEAGWRQSEERYQSLANNGLGMVYQFALAPDGTYSFPLIGESCREILQLSPAALRRDANALFNQIAPEDRAVMRASMARSAATLEPWDWEGEIRTPDDQRIKWIAAASRPQRQPDGTVLWDGILTDATVRRAAEVALRAANRALEAQVVERSAALAAETAERRRGKAVARLDHQGSKTHGEEARRKDAGANAARSQFLSRMSHELRTPLNAILGFGQLLELDATTVAQNESVAHILGAGRHLLALIEEVLDIARLDCGRLRLEVVPVMVADVAEEAVSLVRHTVQGSTVGIEYHGEPDPPRPGGNACVRADGARLRQVLVNLLSNAVKYNVPGGHAGLRVHPPANGGASVRLEVWDTGRGIAPEHHARLFEPFERLGVEHSDAEGTGIGLAISKRLVEAMGGRIGVQSVPGKGSTFWLELPVAREELEF